MADRSRLGSYVAIRKRSDKPLGSRASDGAEEAGVDSDGRPLRATETLSAEDAIARLPAVEMSVLRLLRRLQGHMQLPPGAQVLDIGAAQGTHVAAFARAGYDTVGIEPWRPSVQTSAEVGEQLDIDLRISCGHAESLPFPDECFDLVHAQTVMEHVSDPGRVFEEASRVLREGGGFFFYTCSALCPRQHEISRFPAFPWYPAPVRRRIMNWAKRERPWMIGYTETPAYHWYTPWRVQREAKRVGFVRVLSRWDLIRNDELSGWRRRGFTALRHWRVGRLAGDVLIPNCSYLLLKQGP